MEYTDDNIREVAKIIVDSLDMDDLVSYVEDDLCVTMEQDEEMFHINVEAFVNND
tara:strand:+ start:286 stop:450 length:165 start_codon:yes stop_codon:yes gene_type:complete